MKRKLQPRMEALESKALLSSVAGSAAHPHATQPAHLAPSEPGARNAISVTLTTNESVYQPGQVVQMSLTETNRSNHSVKVAVGPTIDTFEIAQNGKVVWRSDSGFLPQYVYLKVLRPGASTTVKAHWTVTAGMSGSFTVTALGFPQAAATFSVTSASSSGGTASTPSAPGAGSGGGSGSTAPGGTGTSTPSQPIVIHPVSSNLPGTGNVGGKSQSPSAGGGINSPTPDQPVIVSGPLAGTVVHQALPKHPKPKT
jgi:Intracellular proteinase inhibitor